MRVPKRRGEEEVRQKRVHDDHLLPETIERMRRTLEKLKKDDRPKAIAETQRLAEMGDFSENVGYQVAKAHLRRLNNKITSLEERLKTAIPIERGSSDGVIHLGSTVVVVLEGVQRTYELVGAKETDPMKGRISHKSPLGQALLGYRVGDEIVFQSPNGEKMYQIVEVT